MLDQWIANLSQELNLSDPLPLESDGSYSFSPEDGPSISISEISGGFALFCIISPCPQQKVEQFLTQAMLGNLFGQGTQGAVLGLSDDYQNVTLSFQDDSIQQYSDFRDKLEDFLNAADFWKTEIAEITQTKKQE